LRGRGSGSYTTATAAPHFPAVGALGPRRLRPCARPTFADGVLRLVVRALVRSARAGAPATGDARRLPGKGQGSAQGEGSVSAVMAGVGTARWGRGGFRCRRGYYWGGIVCPSVRRAGSLTSWMLVLPTRASGADFSVTHKAIGPQPHPRSRGRACRLRRSVRLYGLVNPLSLTGADAYTVTLACPFTRSPLRHTLLANPTPNLRFGL